MNTHTPGPWFTDDAQDSDERRYVMSANAPFPGTVAIVTLDIEEAEANAALIAAAPEMLDALLYWERCMNDDTDMGEMVAEFTKLAYYAIAKATGAQT
jgi:phosphoribosylcarboxyaminoimidazole (NCAIR) mutase